MSLGDTKMMQMSYSPLGRAIMGGMLTGTFLTPLIVPLFYTLFADLLIYVSSQIRSVYSQIKSVSIVSDSTHFISYQRDD